MQQRPVIELYYDVVSPYSYLAFEALLRYEKQWNVNLRLCPFYLGGAMKESSNRPPMTVPARARFMIRDLKRCSDEFNVQLRLPHQFPFNSIEAMRVLTAIDMGVFTTSQSAQENHRTPSAAVRESLLREVSRAYWRAVFVDAVDTSDLTSYLYAPLRRVSRAYGLTADDCDALVAARTRDDIKQRLIEVTKAAVALGTFGAPTMIVRKEGDNGKYELFFGSDRLQHLALYLGVIYDGPVPRAINISNNETIKVEEPIVDLKEDDIVLSKL